MNDTILNREANTRSAAVHRSTIPAGGVFPVQQYGNSFYVLLCTAPVEIKTDHTPEKPYRKGTGERFIDELRFTRIEIRNPNSYAVTIQIWVGFGEYIDSRIEVQENYTEIFTANPAGSIAGSTSLSLTGAPTVAGQISRKAIVISNLDVSTALVVLDDNDDFCAAVFAQTSITLPISGPVKVRNTTGISVSCYVSEIWYMENAA